MAKNFLLMLLTLSTTALVIACASLPTAQYDFVQQQRSFVQKYELARYVADEAAIAESNYLAGVEYYSNNKKKEATTELDLATNHYAIIIEKGMPLATDARAELSEAQKELASSVKADVAVKDEFAAAQAKLDEALKARDAKNYTNALSILDEATSLFSTAYTNAKTKRDRSEASIEAEKKTLAAIESMAESIERERKAAEAAAQTNIAD